jgi:glyoxylase-like metal-dependent hydrolase (beta-lactamase superfamily II)/rhodanese-related sulfurtransferase
VDLVAFVDEGLGNSCYLMAVGDGRAIAIDPPRDVAELRAAAESRSLTIAFSVETHLHADFVSGSRELAALGATVVGSRAAGLVFPHRPLDDGDRLDLGGLALEAIATPGHTPEHLAYLLRDGSRPLALFSGGALLPGSVARTDLIAPERTEPLARELYTALHARILGLPDALAVYPTHGGGSFCSTAASGERTTTIGREKAANPLLQAPDEDAFVERLFASYGSYPTYFSRLREVNRRGPRVWGTLPALRVLALEEVDRLRRDGAEIIDVRPTDAFAAGHIPRSLAIALRPSFASWLGWLVPEARPLVFVLEPGQDRREVVRQALGIGYEELAGELDGGIDAWTAAGRGLVATPFADPLSIASPMVDVRQRDEYVAGHVPGALGVELGSLPGAASALPPRVVVSCAGADRAMTAASVLERRGGQAEVMSGGADRWSRETRRPVEVGPGTAVAPAAD